MATFPAPRPLRQHAHNERSATSPIANATAAVVAAVVAVAMAVVVAVIAIASSTTLAETTNPPSATVTTLRGLADTAGIRFGVALDPSSLSDTAHLEVLAEQVNVVSTGDELSLSVTQPSPGSFDFTRADAVIDFAVAHDMVVRGHTLIGPVVPEWIAGAEWTSESLSEVLREHITTVIGHYRDRNPGVVIHWDVLGEAFLPSGELRPTVWQRVIGTDHIRIAFEAARAADPVARLFYDDFFDDVAITQDAVAASVDIASGANSEQTTCDVVPKCVAIRDRIGALRSESVPIDGIGFQSHIFSPNPADLGQLSAWVGELAMIWAITEFDVPLPVTELDSASSLEFQAAAYAAALASCMNAVNCDTFITSGASDRFSPVPAATGGAFAGALWLDSNDAPKAAFDALAEVLMSARAPAPASTSASTLAATTTTIEPAPAPDPTSGASSVSVIGAIAALVVVALTTLVVRRRRRTESAAA